MPVTRLKLVVVIIFFLLVSNRAHAQPLFAHTDSLESLVANADSIYVAKLEKFGERQRRDDGHEAHNTTIAIEQTLKRVMFRDYSSPKRQMWMAHHESILSGWQQRASRLLVVTDEYNPFATTVIELEDGKTTVMRADFTLLRDPQEVIKTVKEIVRGLSPAVKRINTFRVNVPQEVVADTEWEKCYRTGGHLVLSVPVDEQLEELARENTRSDDYRTRTTSARALRYFPSEENIVRLKQLLDDPLSYSHRIPEGNKSIEEKFYGVRKEAFETLQAWGVEVEKPVLRERNEVPKTDE